MIQGQRAGETISTGTGFVYKTDDKYGYVLTNSHVVEDSTNLVLVMSNDEEVEGTLLGNDQYLDLAVIRIDKSKVITISSIGDSTKTEVGDTVFTIGTPMGYEFRGTVTSGIEVLSFDVADASDSDLRYLSQMHLFAKFSARQFYKGQTPLQSFCYCRRNC